MDELPKNWVKCSLGEIISTKKGRKPDSTADFQKSGYIPYILIDEMEGKPVRAYTNDPKVSVVNKGDVLLVWDGSIGKCGSGLEGAIGSTLVGLTPLCDIPTKLVEYLLMFNNSLIKATSTGTGLQHINKDFFKICEIFLPPLTEQQRIVTKVDLLFAQIDIIKNSLKRVPELLKIFRQQVLTQAVNGKLTEEWRKDYHLIAVSNSDLESERERVKKNNALLSGKKSFSYKKSIEPILNINTKGIDEFHHIPESWRWLSLDQILWNVSDGPHFSPSYVSSLEGKRFISMRNVSEKGIDFSDCKYVSYQNHVEFIKRGKPEKDDILYTKGGSTGIACNVGNDNDFSYWVHVALLKPVSKFVDSIYLKNILNSNLCYKQAQAFTHGVGNQDLGLTRLIKIAFPLPSLSEQHEIVRRVESLFAKADAIEEQYMALKEKIDILPQAILHKAFKGELTEQLDTDGDAADLLKEIQKLKESVTKSKKPKPYASKEELQMVAEASEIIN